MLVQFIFSNYKSFLEESVLDLKVSRVREFSQTVREIGSTKLLPVAAIFGANASGKSNVLNALSVMRSYVLCSYRRDFDHLLENELKSFKFKSNIEKNTLFEVFFINKEGVTFDYGFIINTETRIIQDEWLFTKSKTSRRYKNIFHRDKNQLDLKGLSKKFQKNIEASLKEKELLITLGEILHIPILEEVYDWFYQTEIINFGDPAENYFRDIMAFKELLNNPNEKESIINFLSTFESSIIDIRLSDSNREKAEIQTGHYNDQGETIFLNFREESSGTQKMLLLYEYIKVALEKGSLLVIDELNARLHPLLVKNIIQEFISKVTNPNNAQFIFSTHEIWLLEADILRRDEIWITFKNNLGESELYSLDSVEVNNKKIRQDENYLKNYILGKYEGIPDLKPLNLGNKSNE